MKKQFPIRFIADEFFISELLSDGVEIATEVLLDLSYIHTTSEEYLFSHNILFDSSFKEAIKDKKIRGEALLGAFHPISCPNFLNGEDNISRIIRYAVVLANKKPWKIGILTSKDKEEKYKTNKHYDKVSSAINIYPKEEAIKIIKITKNN